ncbi:MAG: hypothetical protein V4576_03190 [Patescibacteria group bacterium]
MIFKILFLSLCLVNISKGNVFQLQNPGLPERLMSDVGGEYKITVKSITANRVIFMIKPKKGFDWCELQIAVPDGEELDVGEYEAAVNYSSARIAKPMLQLLDNKGMYSFIGGDIDIEEWGRNEKGKLIKASINFTHQIPGSTMITGQLRFNSVMSDKARRPTWKTYATIGGFVLLILILVGAVAKNTRKT